MPLLIRDTIASPTIASNSGSDFVVIRMVGRPLSKQWRKMRLFAVSDDYERLHARGEIYSSQSEINTP
jgi:hypothetical protein